MDPDTLAIAYRVAGAVSGSLVALVIVEPGTLPGFFKRFACSIVMGLIFADVVADYLSWSMIVPNRIIAASFLAGMLGWFVADAAIRFARTRAGEYLQAAIAKKVKPE